MTKTKIQEKLNRIEEILSTPTDTFLSLKQAAKYLHLSRSYLYKLVHWRRINFSKPGGKLLYFSKNDLDKWILTGKQKTNSELDTEAENYIRRKGRIK